jgi:hypothetical protein
MRVSGRDSRYHNPVKVSSMSPLGIDVLSPSASQELGTFDTASSGSAFCSRSTTLAHDRLN